MRQLPTETTAQIANHVLAGVLAFGFVFFDASATLGQLTINLQFSSFENNPPANLSSILVNDDWDNSTPNSVRIAAAKTVIEHARDEIEDLFANCTDASVTQTIDVSWLGLGGNTLAQGGTGWTGSNQLVGGILRWDNDGSSTFFVDLTPGLNEEFTASGNDTRTIDFGGIDVNVEDRWYANFINSDAGNNSDMLSVAIHEMLHALGVLGAYPPYANLDVGGDGDLDLFAEGNFFEVSYSGGHTTFTLSWDGPGSLGGNYYPNVIGPSIVTGTRGLLTDIDALLLANMHGFGDSDFNCVNQPHSTIPIAVPETVVPVTVAVTAGNLASGGATQLASSDNADLSIRRSNTDIQSQTVFELEAVSPTDNPTLFDITLEGSVFARTTVNQTIELWDYDDGEWVNIDTRTASRFVDGTAIVSPTGDLSRFVETGVGTILARVRFNSLDPRQNFTSNSDLFTWTIQ